MDPKSLVEPIVALAEDAGHAILEVYATDFEVQSKDDASPVTQADLAAHRWIDAGLRSLTPDIPIISEESGLAGFEERSAWELYWIVDPLDGTKEFVNRNDEFTVNIALIERGVPILGVVHVPVYERTYVGCQDLGAQRRDGGNDPVSIRIADSSGTPPRIVGSRSHRGKSLDDYLESYYGQPAEALKSFMTCYAGPSEGAAQLLDAYASAGVSHMVLRFAGDHDRLLETMVGIRESLGWATAS